jgi:hypothetical protein
VSAEPEPLELLDLDGPARAPKEQRPRPRRVNVGPGLDPDDPQAEKEPPDVRKIGFEPADAFLARLDAQGDPGWVVGDLVPEDGIAVWHGRPRSMKSLAALEMSLAAAIAEPAFGCERFATSTGDGSVLYLTEEDGARLIAMRLRLMLAGRGLKTAPSRLRILSRPGWNLEQTSDQAAVLTAIREVSPAPVLLTIDPARGSMPALDKGPSDAASAIRFVRQLQRETSIRAVLILHHDIKPPRDGKDERARAERASGGAVFSIADCPVNFERVDDRSCFPVPSTFKVGADPKPFRILFESATPPGEPFRDFLRARTITTDERTEAATRAEAEVLRVLDAADDWMGTDAVIERSGPGRRADKLAALKKLAEAGRVTQWEAGRGGKAREWRRGLVS